jgi:hypothetical protein
MRELDYWIEIPLRDQHKLIREAKARFDISSPTYKVKYMRKYFGSTFYKKTSLDNLDRFLAISESDQEFELSFLGFGGDQGWGVKEVRMLQMFNILPRIRTQTSEEFVIEYAKQLNSLGYKAKAKKGHMYGGWAKTLYSGGSSSLSPSKSGVFIEEIGSRVYVSGKTFGIKDSLKALGFRWDRDMKSWWVDSRSYPRIRNQVEQLIR